MRLRCQTPVAVAATATAINRNDQCWRIPTTHACPASPNWFNFISCEKPTPQTYCINAVTETRCRWMQECFPATLNESDVQFDSYAKLEFGTDEVGDVMLIYVNWHIGLSMAAASLTSRPISEFNVVIVCAQNGQINWCALTDLFTESFICLFGADYVEAENTSDFNVVQQCCDTMFPMHNCTRTSRSITINPLSFDQIVTASLSFSLSLNQRDSPTRSLPIFSAYFIE